MSSSFDWKKINKTASPYKTPDGYFQQFTDKLEAEICQHEKQKIKRVKRYALYSSIAAALLVFALILPSTWDTPTLEPTKSVPQEHKIAQEGIAQENSADYIYDYLMLNTNIIYQYETEDN